MTRISVVRRRGLWPSNRLRPNRRTLLRMARAISGAMDSTVSCGNASAGMGRVLVTTTSRAPESARRQLPGPEKQRVQAMMTSLAPAFRPTAPEMVPPVDHVVNGARRCGLQPANNGLETASVGHGEVAALRTKASGHRPAVPPTALRHGRGRCPGKQW